MNIDEAIERLTARVNCNRAYREGKCNIKCSECPLYAMQGDIAESWEVDRYALAALITIKNWKKAEIK